jgi:hypothetical protein
MSTLRLPSWLGEDPEEMPAVRQNGHLPEPEDPHRVAKAVGKVIGIAFFGGIVHVVLAGRRIAQAIGSRVAAMRPKEAR